jgi:hypothetical protein
VRRIPAQFGQEELHWLKQMRDVEKQIAQMGVVLRERLGGKTRKDAQGNVIELRGRALARS